MLVFVYGTLKKGFINEPFLADQKFLGRAVLFEPKYRLYEVTGNYKFPALVEVEHGGYPVYGEVYDVSDVCLGYLDRLEGVELGLYKRTLSQVRLEDGRLLEGVTIYTYCRKLIGADHIGQVWPIDHLSLWQLVGKKIVCQEATIEKPAVRLWDIKQEKWATKPFGSPEELRDYCLRSPGKYGGTPFSPQWFEPRPTKMEVDVEQYSIKEDEENGQQSPFHHDDKELCEWASEHLTFFDGTKGDPAEWAKALSNLASKLEGIP